jgi:ribosomal protein L16 Arg81 hydroxylase
MDQMTMEELGEPLVDTILKPGEMLYMPAGAHTSLSVPPVLPSPSLPSESAHHFPVCH